MLHHIRSSNPPPNFCPPCACPVDACAADCVELAEGAFAPQIPALVCCFAKSASLGPWLPAVEVFLIPAVALAEDHKEPKASPPPEDDFPWAGLLNDGVDVIGELMPAEEG